jgi:hypothetical protein
MKTIVIYLGLLLGISFQVAAASGAAAPHPQAQTAPNQATASPRTAADTRYVFQMSKAEQRAQRTILRRQIRQARKSKGIGGSLSLIFVGALFLLVGSMGLLFPLALLGLLFIVCGAFGIAFGILRFIF